MKLVDTAGGTQYVAGFLIRQNQTQEEQVLLIRKARPTWMAGRWNGVGGKVEKGETHHAAMIRECREETGLLITDWHHFATLVIQNQKPFEDATIAFYAADSVPSGQLVGSEEEPVQWWAVRRLPPTVLNLHWLIPMARAALAGGLGGQPLLVVEEAGNV